MARSKKAEKTKDGKFRGVVYEYKLLATNQVYIGETNNEAVRRQCWTKKNSIYGGKKITEARKKYGVRSAWSYTVLEEIICDSEHELNDCLMKRQQYWIEKKDAVTNGLNSSYGDGMQGRKHSDASRQQISQNHRHYQDQAARQKISQSLKGRNVSDETRQKISQKNAGKTRTPEQKKAQSARMKGIVPLAAKKGADEWRIKNGGSYWKGKKMPASAVSKLKAIKQANGTKTIATFPDGQEVTFNTMLDAANACGLNVGSVASAMNTGGTTKNGYKFKKAS